MYGNERLTVDEVLEVIDVLVKRATDSLTRNFHSSHEEYCKAYGVLAGVQSVRKHFSSTAEELLKHLNED